jgi:hypothetical protein
MSKKKKDLEAVKLMREIRDRLAKAEEGLTWEQRKAKLHQDLEANSQWIRLKSISRPAVSGQPVLRR